MLKKINFNLETPIRIDKYLVSELPKLTRSYLQKLITEGKILVNNQNVKTNFKLKNQGEISINIPKPQKIEAQAEKIKLNIVYEDKDLIIINKPAGMVVHPSDSGNNISGTVVNAILYHCQKNLKKGKLSGINGKLRPGIIHRLDKNTSGLLIIAKNDQAHQNLSKQIKNREIKKIYWTLVQGDSLPDTGSINAPLYRDPRNRLKMAVSTNKKAKSALTNFRVIKKFKNYRLLEVQIITGRTHQIRAHFESIRHPIIGDILYGNDKTNQKFAKLGLKRQFLHAKKLGIKLPATNKFTTFEIPLAEDLNNTIKQLD